MRWLRTNFLHYITSSYWNIFLDSKIEVCSSSSMPTQAGSAFRAVHGQVKLDSLAFLKGGNTSSSSFPLCDTQKFHGAIRLACWRTGCGLEPSSRGSYHRDQKVRKALFFSTKITEQRVSATWFFLFSEHVLSVAFVVQCQGRHFNIYTRKFHQKTAKYCISLKFRRRLWRRMERGGSRFQCEFGYIREGR